MTELAPLDSDSAPATIPTQERHRLPRTLNTFTLGFIFVAFAAPLSVLAGWLQPAIAFGNGIGAPAAFLAAGALFLLFQVGTLAMSRRMKRPGAFYTYIAEGIGKPAALAGSFLALAAYITMTVSGYVYTGVIIGNLMKQVAGSPLLPWQVWGLVVFAIVTVLNLLRIDLSAKAVAVGVILEIIIVAAYEAVVLIKGGPEGYSPASFSPMEFLGGSPGLAVLFALSTLTGLEALAVFREEVRDPQRTVPRAAYGAITFTTLFFALAAWSYIIAIGPSHVIDDARNAPVDSFTGSVETYMGGFAPTLVAVLLVTSQLAAVNSGQATAIRYLYTLGHDRVLPSGLARVHTRLGSPYVAVMVSIGLCLAIYLSVQASSDNAALIYGIVGGFGTIFLLPLLLGTCASVILFFKKNPGHGENAWKSWIAPGLAFVGLATVLIFALTNLELMVGNQIVGMLGALGLILIIAVGVAAALWFKKNRPDAYDRIGRQVD
ncbi:APC family permease [Nocardia sp. NPDC052254]|uniref:APC family permease n=1 Tax=Nocardia sp. NPDC052254 TaxID=3155681 RepID=UPI00342925F8